MSDLGDRIVEPLIKSLDASWKEHHFRSSKAELLRRQVRILADCSLNRNLRALADLLDWIEGLPSIEKEDSTTEDWLERILLAIYSETPNAQLGRKMNADFKAAARSKKDSNSKRGE